MLQDKLLKAAACALQNHPNLMEWLPSLSSAFRLRTLNTTCKPGKASVLAPDAQGLLCEPHLVMICKYHITEFAGQQSHHAKSRAQFNSAGAAYQPLLRMSLQVLSKQCGGWPQNLPRQVMISCTGDDNADVGVAKAGSRRRGRTSKLLTAGAGRHQQPEGLLPILYVLLHILLASEQICNGVILL